MAPKNSMVNTKKNRESGDVKNMDKLPPEIFSASPFSKKDTGNLLSALLLTDMVSVTDAPVVSPLLWASLMDQNLAVAAYAEEFFASETVKMDPTEPPPISSEELAEEMKLLDEIEDSSNEENGSMAPSGLSRDDLAGLHTGRSDPVRYLAKVGLAMVVAGILFSALILHSYRTETPRDLSNQKRVDKVGGDLKPLFTKAIDLYHAGIKRMESGKLGDLQEARKYFILALEIVPEYQPAIEALERVEQMILKQKGKLPKPAKPKKPAKNGQAGQ